MHLVGTPGSGKSEIASLLSSFYGQFSRDTPPAQWGDTINTVETLGYPLTDSLFWVDDYKSIYADEKTFTRFLQSCSCGMGRGRLTREAKVRHEKLCCGLILSTGETTIEGKPFHLCFQLHHTRRPAIGAGLFLMTPIQSSLAIQIVVSHTQITGNLGDRFAAGFY